MKYQFVSMLPDLIHAKEYASDPDGKRVRFRIRITNDGIELLGDAVRPKILEALLLELEPAVIEQMLCG